MKARDEKPRLIMIGAGMAAMRFLDELLALTDAYHIKVFNRESHAGYNRIMLSPVLAGEKSLQEIVTHDDDWFQQHSIELYNANPIIDINRVKQTVTDVTGQSHHYDRLVIATGAQPVILPLENHALEGVLSFRDIGDVQKMQQHARFGKRAVIVGGGLLGLEAAYGLQQQGMQVSVIQRSDVLMNTQLDAKAGRMLQQQLAKDSRDRSGMDFHLATEVTEIIADSSAQHIAAVQLKNGQRLSCDLLVMAIGIRPNIQLAQTANLAVNRGVLVDDYLQTEDLAISALGECVEHRGHTYGLVAPLYEQAKVLAQQLFQALRAEPETVAPYQGSMTSTMLKVTGINLFSAGDFNASTEGSETLLFHDSAQKIYRKLVIANQQIIGALLYGDTYEANWLFDLLQQKTDISEIRETVLFGQGF